MEFTFLLSMNAAVGEQGSKQILDSVSDNPAGHLAVFHNPGSIFPG